MLAASRSEAVEFLVLEGLRPLLVRDMEVEIKLLDGPPGDPRSGRSGESSVARGWI